MQFPVSIELHRSVLLISLLVLIHALAAVCVSALPWPWLLRGALLVLAGLSLWISLRPNRILGLRLCAHDQVEGVLYEGHLEVLSILPDTTVFTWLIVLRFRLGDEQKASKLALLPDQVTPEQFRSLRQWLRWHVTPKSPGAQSF